MYTQQAAESAQQYVQLQIMKNIHLQTNINAQRQHLFFFFLEMYISIMQFHFQLHVTVAY